VCAEYRTRARHRRRAIGPTGYGHRMQRRIAVPALFATAASGVAYALLRMRRGREPSARANGPAGTGRAGELEPPRQDFLVSGAGRHRVYWLPDASPSDPVLSPTCPRCERPLPREAPAADAPAR
jgi:hypothetical protein